MPPSKSPVAEVRSPAPSLTPTTAPDPDPHPAQIARQVVAVLAAMTYEERVRAYRCRVFDPRELAVAAARLPDEVPILNGELEWIAIDAE